MVLTTSHLIINAQTFTQEVIASDGGYYKQLNGSLQFTIGEPLTETYKSAGATMYQGFEQDSYTILSISEFNSDSTIIACIFPNPTSDYVNVSVASSITSDFNIKIYDLLGNILLTSFLNTDEPLKINLTQFPSAIFYITISNKENTFQKRYKIFKVK